MSRRSTTPPPASLATDRPAVAGRRRTAAGSLLCAACLVAGVGLAAAPARAGTTSHRATSHRATSDRAADRGAGTAGVERATSMLPTYTPDGAAVRAAGQVSPASSTPTLQPVATGDLNGIDVASYQHPGGAAINWPAVRAGGVSFAYVKSSEGNYYKNPYYVQDVTAARAAGISVGAYHFAEPNTPAIAQADDFAAAARAAGTTLPPVLDLEVNDGLGVAALQTWTATFLARVRSDLGVVPVIYTGPSFWGTDMGGSAAFVGYPLWVANYRSSAAPEAVGAWKAWTYWQWSDGSYPAVGAVPGIAGYVDRDRFAGTATDRWLNYVGPRLQGAALSSLQHRTYASDIARGASRQAVAFEAQETTAGIQYDIRYAYLRLLGRAADPAGLATWTQWRGSGRYSEFGMLLSMTESSEFWLASGRTDAGFVTRLYQLDLGRTPSADVVAAWETTIAARGRNAVAYDIGFSPEAINVAVNRAYVSTLGRVATPAELAVWSTSAMRAGTRWESFLAVLYGSTQFATAHNLS